MIDYMSMSYVKKQSHVIKNYVYCYFSTKKKISFNKCILFLIIHEMAYVILVEPTINGSTLLQTTEVGIYIHAVCPSDCA